MVADILAKMDQARAMTAALQVDYRTKRDAYCRAQRAKADKRFRVNHPTRVRSVSAASSARRRVQIDATRADDAERFIEFLHANQTACPICLDYLSPPSVDHITPLARGGRHEPNNLILLCLSCNSRKGDQLNYPPAYRYRGISSRLLACDEFETGCG